MTDPRSRRVLACLFWVLFLGIADNQVVSPLLPAIQVEFGRTPQQLGLLYTGYSVCAGILVLLWGPLSDRRGRLWGLVVGLCLFASGAAAAAAAKGFAWLLVARMLGGAGASMLSLNVIAYAGDFWPYERRGRAMGFIFSSYFAALILGVPLGAWLGHAAGWRSVFAVLALVAIASAGFLRLLLPSIQAHAPAGSLEAMVAGQLRVYGGFLARPRTLAVLASNALASGGTASFLAFLSIWMSARFGLTSREIGLVFLASGAAALLASPLAGVLSDRVGKRRQFWVSSSAMAGFLLLLPFAWWGPILFLVSGAISMSAAFRQGPLEALTTEVADPGARGSFVAAKNSFSQLGIALSAAAAGFLFERAGYSSVCLWSAACNLAAALIIGRAVRERHL